MYWLLGRLNHQTERTASVKRTIVLLVVAALPCLAVLAHSLPCKSATNIDHVEPVKLPGCDFTVYFPCQIQTRQITSGGITLTRVESAAGSKAYMRAECMLFDDTNRVKTVLQEWLMNLARENGLPNPEISVGEGKYGAEGTFLGMRKAGGFDLRVYGKMFVGRKSVLALTTIDPTPPFPSDTVLFFISTVEMK